MQSSLERKVSGVIVDRKDAVLNGITVIARGASGERRTTTNEAGQFSVAVPDESISLRIEGQYIKPQDINLPLKALWDALRIEVEYSIPPVHQSIVIRASALDPQVETYGDEVYRRTLFSRDDQLLETLNSGISAGQHEGGGSRWRFVDSDSISIMVALMAV